MAGLAAALSLLGILSLLALRADPYTSVVVRPATPRVKVLFYVFPQWHEVPENNRNLGWNHTDWKLLDHLHADAPDDMTIQLPSELGFYNMLSRTTRHQQKDLLLNHGGHGFIYHTYWFTDHPVMDEPLRQMLDDPEFNVPFMFNWANEDWTARWAGQDGAMREHVDMLPEANRRAMWEYYLPYFRDPRYIRIKGKPVFQAYQSDKDMELVFGSFKQWAVEAGLPGIHCMQTLAHFHDTRFDPNNPLSYHPLMVPNLDGVSEFQPNMMGWGSVIKVCRVLKQCCAAY